MRAPLPTLPTLVALAVLAGCGSRTGLRLPEWTAQPPEALCFELPPDGRLVVDLSTDARLHRADVFMLLDTTSSMREEIDEIARRLRGDIAPEIFETIPDTEFGVGIFGDFPVPELGYGASSDFPYALRLPMSGDLIAVQNALDDLPEQDGLDPWESQIEALYQVATGEGLGGYVPPSPGCPNGGFGGPCFRVDAQPVVLMFTDAPFHDGPASERNPEAQYLPGTLDPPPHSYTETLRALVDRRIRLVGLWSGQEQRLRRDLELSVQDSGSVDQQGSPIVFDIGSDGSSLGSGVVNVLQNLAGALVYDVDAYASDPTPGDGIDTAALVERITPLEARPMDGVAGIDPEGSRFLGVVAGTTLVYEVVIVAGSLLPGPEPQRFVIRVNFRGDGATSLGERDLTLVVPSIDGRGCEALLQ